MGISMRFISVLVAALLLAAPVAVVSAQTGTGMDRGSESGAPSAGFAFNGFTYVPDLAVPAQPEALPQVGAGVVWLTGRDRQTILDGIAAGGGTIGGAQPNTLPQTGMDLGGLTGRDRQTILDQIAAAGGNAPGQ